MAITKTFPVGELVFGRGVASVREEVEEATFHIIEGSRRADSPTSNPFLDGRYEVKGRLREVCRSNTSQAVRRRHQEASLILSDGDSFTALKVLLLELYQVLPHRSLSEARGTSYVTLEWDFVVVGCATDMLDLVPRERPVRRVITDSIATGTRQWRPQEPKVEIVQSLDELLSFLGSTRDEIKNTSLNINSEGGAASGTKFFC